MTFAIGCFVGENILYNRTDVSRRNGGVLSKQTKDLLCTGGLPTWTRSEPVSTWRL